MGKGDRKTRRGKIYSGSYGNPRAHSAKAAPGADGKAAVKAKPAVKKAAVRKKPAA